MNAVFVAWALSAGGLILLAALLGALVRGSPLGILIDTRGRYSLTHFQLTVWTVVVLSLISGVFWGRLQHGVTRALDFDIPSQVLLLLGISVGSSVMTSTIKAIKDASISGRVAASSDVDKPRLAQMFLVEEGVMADQVIDITKFQNFWITVILAVSYVALAIHAVSTVGDVKMLVAIPGFSSPFVTLLAISHGGYIVGKVPNQAGNAPGLTVEARGNGVAPPSPRNP